MSGEAAGHFGPYAEEYGRFRPDYPRSLLDRVAELAPRRGTVWECGAGSGQATAGLAARFRRVLATDATRRQLAGAPPVPRAYRIAALAEAAPLASGCADLAVAAQALHWFANGPFFDEVRRVVRPGGALVAWCYGLPVVGERVDAVLRRFHGDILGPWWRPERRHVLSGYETLEVPFPALAVDVFTLEKRWPLERFTGYLGTWSAAREYASRHGVSALADIDNDLAEAWAGERGGGERPVRWPLTLRVWSLPTPSSSDSRSGHPGSDGHLDPGPAVVPEPGGRHSGA